MQKCLREGIIQIVRDHVRRQCGDDTCVGSIRVLGKVLRIGWGIELKPHVVHLRVIPARALEIVNNPSYSDEEKKRLAALLPTGHRPVEMVSQGNRSKFHLIGSTFERGEGILWDPSIDQVNQHFAECRLAPICVPYFDVGHTDDKEWDVVDIGGCRVMYSAEKRLEEEVFGCSAWLMSYEDLTRTVLAEIRERGLLPKAGLTNQ